MNSNLKERHKLYPIVFVGGFTGLFLQIQAGRSLAIHYGSTTYTWGSILSVFMISLGLGYYIAGLTADGANKKTLIGIGNLILLSLAVPILFLETVVSLVSTTPIPEISQPFFTSLLVYGIPGLSIGFFSPYAVELIEKRDGEAAGRIYSVGTAGSICGALGTTFIFIPQLGATTSFIVLVLLFGISLIILSRNRKDIMTVLIIVSLITTITIVPITTSENTVYKTQSSYQQIQVIDENNIRTLYVNGIKHSAINKSNESRYVFRYYRYMHAPLAYKNESEINDVLLIGGGGGVISKKYAQKYNASVDVVELDPAIHNVAKRYFNATHPNVEWHIQDGREYLRESDKKYDVILLDAFSGSSIPIHMTTVEFYSLAEQDLKADGVLAVNIISSISGRTSTFSKRETATLDSVFSTTRVYTTAPEKDDYQNIILVGTNNSPPTNQTLRERSEQLQYMPLTDSEITNYFTPRQVDAKSAEILTDENVAEVELLPPGVQDRVVRQKNNQTG